MNPQLQMNTAQPSAELEAFANLLANYTRLRLAREASTNVTQPARSSALVGFEGGVSNPSATDRKVELAKKYASIKALGPNGTKRQEQKYFKDILAALTALEHSLQEKHFSVKIKGQVLEVFGDQVTINKLWTEQTRVSFEPSEYTFHIVELGDIQDGKFEMVLPLMKRSVEDHEYLHFVLRAQERPSTSFKELRDDPTTISSVTRDANPSWSHSAICWRIISNHDWEVSVAAIRSLRQQVPVAPLAESVQPPRESAISRVAMPPPVEIADELKKLAELRNANVLSEEQFQRQKQKLLSL